MAGFLLNYASGAASKANSARKTAQALVVTRQVYFDLNAENITLSGGQFGKGHVLSPKNYNVSWEFVRSNGTGFNINVSNTKEFTNQILEITGG